MRIAYVAIHLEKKFILGGVGRKILTQIQLWQGKGHQVHFFLHSPDNNLADHFTNFQFNPKIKLPILKTFSREWSRSRKLQELISTVTKFQPDVIYFRYGLYAYPLHRLFKIAPSLVEVNTHDVLEYRHRSLFYYWVNYLTRELIFRNCAGIVPISSEIADLHSISKFGKPIQVIPNGFNLDEIQPLPAPCNDPPHVSFVGNMKAVWNGVDKLILFAQRNPDILVDIIGMTRGEIDSVSVPENVICHGLLSLDDVRKILALSDASISALALHRKPSFENSLLKVRESLAFGIPTILAHHDSDVSGKGFDFVLQIPNTENNVLDHHQEMRAFIFKMVGKRADLKKLEPLINQKYKEDRRLEFLRRVYEKNLS